jgi:uncharacterized protein YodC (DUF2158 family)
MSEQFKPGDQVQLASGGPKMTVKWVGESYGEPAIACVWFNKDKDGDKPMEHTFPPAALRRF